jgi:hypothetical protein
MKKILTIVSILAFAVGCSGKKKKNDLSLKELQEKRVALVDVQGAKDSKIQVEISLLNEIIENGRFQIVDKATVDEAMSIYPAETDYKALAKKIEADLLLAIKIETYDIVERKGYDKVEEEDSILAQESGESKVVIGSRFVKVKSLEGKVSLIGFFYDGDTGELIKRVVAEAHQNLNSRDQVIQRKMQLLESLSKQAVHNLFENLK